MHIFDQDTALDQQAPARFKGKLTDNWSVNGIPNGGYLMALLAKAMLQGSAKKHPLIVTVNYLHRCLIDEADLVIENIATSKRFDRWHATLSQEGRKRLHGVGTFVDPRDEPAEKSYESAPPEIADIDVCVPMPALPRYTLFDRMDLRLDPSCAGWLQGSPGGRSIQKGWARFKEPRPFDMLSVLLIADAFPPPALASHGMVAWIPTIEFSVNLRNLPRTEWLKCIYRTRFINNGILEEDGEVWDADGELIAICRQIAQFRKST